MTNTCIILGCKKFTSKYEVCGVHLSAGDQYALIHNVSVKEGCREIIKMRGAKPNGKGSRRRKTKFDA